MFSIIKNQLISGLSDARFLFMFVIVITAFICNGIIYSENYKLAEDDMNRSIASTTDLLSARSSNLQEVAVFFQVMTRPPSSLTFIADGGDDKLPNTASVNAFYFDSGGVYNRNNPRFPILPPIDWVFIIGTLMSLMAIMLSFGSICGDKKSGILKQVLSYPVSRLTLFFGKYLGILFSLIIALFIGIVFNLTVIIIIGHIPLSFALFNMLVIALMAGILCLSLAALGGMVVSSLVHNPSVSLVICMVLWLVGIIAVPGISRLIGENLVTVPTPAEITQLTEQSFGKIWATGGDARGFQHTEEFLSGPIAKKRSEIVNAIVNDEFQIKDEFDRKCSNQVETINLLGMLTPSGVLNRTLQKISGTGLPGYLNFRETVMRYKNQLSSFVYQQDKVDPDSYHLIYAWWGGHEGTFSSKPVELSSIPRSHNLFRKDGIPQDLEFPWLEFILFLAANLQMALVAIFALNKYDPR